MAFDASQWMTPSGGYEIDNSLRFEDADSSFLSYTPSAGNRKKWTFSCWIKLGVLGINRVVFAGGAGASTYLRIFDTDVIGFGVGGDADYAVGPILRDPNAWYHIVWKADTTIADGGDGRMQIFVNGERVYNASPTSWSQNHDTHFFEAELHSIGKETDGSSADRFFDGYLAEAHLVEGLALTADSFGETGTYGEWKPIEYLGSHGDEGFYLDFKSSGVGTAGTATVGADRSGNTNHLTSSGLAATDQMLDTPTNNFATLNALQPHTQTLSEGNLKTVTAVSNASNSTIGATSGKWYAEFNFISGTHCRIGISAGQAGLGENHGFGAGNTWVKINGRIHYHDSTAIPANSGVSIAADDIVGVAVDVDAGKLWFSKNGTWEDNASGTGVPADGTNPIYNDAGIRSGEPIFFGVASGSGDLTYVANFGQDSSFAGAETAQGNADGNGVGDFYYAPPTGFLALCTSNLPAVAVVPSAHFNTVLYTGDGSSSQVISGVGFQPDFSWIKERSSDSSHHLFNAVVGYNKGLFSNGTNVESDQNMAVASDGYTLGSSGGINENTETYVGFNWKANGSGASNTDGSINTTKTSANVDAGFSMSTYTGTGSAATIGHGLSKAPEMIIVKNRVNARNWRTYHKYSGASDPETDYLNLDETAAVADHVSWNDTAPTSSVFSITNNGDRATNYSGDTFVAYCFHSVDGYSKVGSYTGNGNADGVYVHLGFRPMFVIAKVATASTHGWGIYNSKSKTYNPLGNVLQANGNNAEMTSEFLDFTSNGFKHRTSSTWNNGSGQTYIYLAFAETPFKYSNGR